MHSIGRLLFVIAFFVGVELIEAGNDSSQISRS